MQFNSIPFALFFPITFIIYWIIGHKRNSLQILFLFLASVFFYGWWDWRFLLLILFNTSVTFFLAQKLEKNPNRIFLYIGVFLSLIFLGFFKYYNFFIENFIKAYSIFGGKLKVETLQLILPLGISYYTFKNVGYLLDVFYGRIVASKKIVHYSLYISFFPQIVAGPIERATNLLPQFQKERPFDFKQSTDGLKLILWGLFKKVVIADTCVSYVNDIFGNYSSYPGSVLVLGVFYFAFQIYADFSGYSDIAMGVCKLLGFETTQNFNYPFISKNITEFWRRWHISLSSWFNDYVFTPLFTAFRNWGNIAMYVAIVFTFILSGLWHGDSWHYVLFGLINGVVIALEAKFKKKRKKIQSKINSVLYANLSMGLTFLFTLFTFTIFKADNIPMAFDYFNRVFSMSFFEIPGKLAYLPIIFVLVIWEWIQRKKEHPLDFIKLPVYVRWIIYIVLSFSVFYYLGQEQEFYYFKF